MVTVAWTYSFISLLGFYAGFQLSVLDALTHFLIVSFWCFLNFCICITVWKVQSYPMSRKVEIFSTKKIWTGSRIEPCFFQRGHVLCLRLYLLRDAKPYEKLFRSSLTLNSNMWVKDPICHPHGHTCPALLNINLTYGPLVIRKWKPVLTSFLDL